MYVRRLFKCGHTGLGKECHRCQQAAAFFARAKSEKNEKKKAEYKAEGERLLAVPRKNEVTAPSAPTTA
jgi:hypothetical protein